MAPHLTDKERQKIVCYLKEGKSQNWTAKKLGRSVDTVGRIGREAGIQSDTRKTKKAVEASAAYALERRVSLIGLGFDKYKELLDKCENPSDYQKLTVGLATLIDKIRLEMGEVTARSESHSHTHARELEDYFEELDAFTLQNSEEDTRESLHSSGANGSSA